MAEGIKETSDVVVAGCEIATLGIKVLHDGFQLQQDFETIWATIRDNADFRNKFYEAYVNIQKVPAEVSDIDLQEGISLGLIVFSYIPKWLAALQGFRK